MNRLAAFSNLPEVKNGVISDMSGTLLEHTGTEDAEAVAAVMGYFVSEIAQCGDVLGFGGPLKVSFSGNNISGVLFLKNNLIWSIYLDPSASQSAFEKKIDALSGVKGRGMPGEMK